MLLSLCAAALCAVAGVLISRHAVAHSAAALALLWGLLLSGFLVPLDELATSEWWLLRRMRDFFPVPVRYAYEALMVNEFEGVDALIITTSLGGGEPGLRPWSGLTSTAAISLARASITRSDAGLMSLRASTSLVNRSLPAPGCTPSHQPW